MYFARRRSSSATWIASSLVGQRIIACVFLFSGSIFMRSGIPKAAVLPVPVCAWPIMSWPSISTGIAWAWIGDAASNPISVTARRIRWSKLSSSNLIVSIQYPFYVVCITIPCQDTFIRRLLRTPRSLYRSQNSIYNTDGSLIFQAIQGANVKYLIT